MYKKITAVIAASAIALQACAASAFYDVEQDSFYAEEIELLAGCGVISGTGGGYFEPYSLVTRAELAKMATVMADVPESPGGSLFKDVPSSEWSAGYINAAAREGIVTGYPGGYFGPEDNLTYAQTVTVALRLLGWNSGNIGGSYPGAYIKKAAALGLTEGLDFGADDYINRQNTAYIFAKALVAEKKDGGFIAEDLGYTVSDECTVIADYKNSADEILTTAGAYSYDKDKERFIGMKVKLVTDDDDGSVAGIIACSDSAERGVIASADANSMTVVNGGRLEQLSVSGSALIYYKGAEEGYGDVRTQLLAGDMIYYTQNGGRIVRAAVASDDSDTPYPASEVNFNGYTVIKNGVVSSAAASDIVYLYPDENAAIAYSTKTSGIFESASPSKENADTITVSGTEYAVSGASAKRQIAALAVNDTVTVSLGRNGAAAAVSKTGSADNVYGIKNVSGNEILCRNGASDTVLAMENTYRVFFGGKDTTWEKIKGSVLSGMRVSVYRDDNGAYEYSVIEENELSVPRIAVSDGVNPFGEASFVVRDSKKASAADIRKDDVVYYSSVLDTAYVYCDKVTGVYERAYPDQQNPSSVTVSGKKYGVETASAASALSALEYDSRVTLLLGKDGGIAGIKGGGEASGSDVSDYGVVISCAKKTGGKASDYYVKVMSAGGEEQEFKTKTDCSYMAGRCVHYSFSDGYVSLTEIKNSSNINGAVDRMSRKIGKYCLSGDCRIADVSYVSDTDEAVVYEVSLGDVNRMSLSSANIKAGVLNSAGEIAYLVLDNVTCSGYSFGIVKSGSGSSQDGYKLDIGGIEKTYQSKVNKSLGFGDAVMAMIINNRIVDMKELFCMCDQKKCTSITSDRVVTSVGTFEIASDAAVYIRRSGDEFSLIPIEDCDEYDIKNVSVYADTYAENGGMARVIVVSIK